MWNVATVVMGRSEYQLLDGGEISLLWRFGGIGAWFDHQKTMQGHFTITEEGLKVYSFGCSAMQFSGHNNDP